MKIQPFGDSSLLVLFEDKISKATNQKVIALFNSLENIEGIRFQIPAYNSLTIGIDLTLWSLHQATIYIRDKVDLSDKDNFNQRGNRYVIPVCYQQDFAPDLNEISRQLELSPYELIELHSTRTYHVFMLGFVAGFAYMGSLDPKLKSQRKAIPRLKVPAGSVGIAGMQTGVYPTEAPGGWQIIGRTPLEMFSPNKENPSLVKLGDQVRFRAISKEEFQIIRIKIETEIFEMEMFNE